jgi:hypothetical protein
MEHSVTDLSDFDRNAEIQRATERQLKVNRDALFREFGLLTVTGNFFYIDPEKLSEFLIRLKKSGYSEGN